MLYEETNQTEQTEEAEEVEQEQEQEQEQIEPIEQVEQDDIAEQVEQTEQTEGIAQAEQTEQTKNTSGEKSMEEGNPQITEDDLDNIADTAIAVLQDILKYFNVGEVTIDEYEGDDGELILDITGDDLAVLIGRHGKTLEALQFLISAITTRSIGFRYPVIVDVEGYKSRQRQKLEAIARSSAKRAVSQHENVKLRPMTPYERRIVHIALRDDDRVETCSEGEGSARHVVIFPK